MAHQFFNTDRKIRLGIWGLGRGSSFIWSAAAVNIEIVAGCDLNAEAREKFKENCPDAFVTADENEFLAFREMDAVLVATWFNAHAEHSIRALEAGFHVMCEVTSFFTPAESVRLVEAVEKSGKVYNLLENYPFSKENMYLTGLWKKGFFGEFQYGEFEYLHDCRTLCYCNLFPDKLVPIGAKMHYWRSWLDFHYYNTHSLGPLMVMTGLRPEYITAVPEDVSLPGFPPGSGMSRPAPSMIKMSNGGVMRNLCGATTGDYHTCKRIWGTRASAESVGGGLKITVGAAGNGIRTVVEPEWPDEGGALAEKAGHGGGDFWELYYFAREILTGEPAPWDIYAACDVTLAGIMAVRSHQAGGQPMEVPDFRLPEVRERWRHDDAVQQRPFDPDRIFPEDADPALTSGYCELAMRLEKNAILLREAADGAELYRLMVRDGDKLTVLRKVREAAEALPELFRDREQAEKVIAAFPDSVASAALRGMLSIAEPEAALGEEALRDKLRKLLSELIG